VGRKNYPHCHRLQENASFFPSVPAYPHDSGLRLKLAPIPSASTMGGRILPAGELHWPRSRLAGAASLPCGSSMGGRNPSVQAPSRLATPAMACERRKKM
jgi:hypothetical protein